jgi:hypothetical protein
MWKCSILLLCTLWRTTYGTPCEHKLSVDITNGKMHINGSISMDGIVYDPKDYFSTKDADGKAEIRGCVCRVRACVRRCCPRGKLINNSTCEDPDGGAPRFAPNVHLSEDDLDNGEKVHQDHFGFIYTDLCEHGKYQLEPEDSADQHYLLKVR